MKRSLIAISIIGLLLLSSIHVVSRTNEQEPTIIQTQISFSQPLIRASAEYTQISLNEQTSTLGQPGAPNLPVVTKQYMLPFGTKIQGITVTYNDFTTDLLSQPILPATEALYISTEYSNDQLKDQIDTTIYLSEKPFPENLYSYRLGSGLHGVEHVLYLTLNLYPIQYHPMNSQITTAQTVDITIQYSIPEQTIVFGDTYDYLILAPSEYTETLQPLVDLKQSQGIETLVRTLDEIPDIGTDIQESIKLFIKDAIETWGITHVLLVGAGIEDQEIFPVRQAWLASGNYERYFPSDLYYADIYDAAGNFSTWDNNSNGRYAEYPQDNAAVDLYPDVALGRLPCNTVEELEIVVQKIMKFIETNTMTHTIVQMGGDTFHDDPERVNEGEFANEEVMKNLLGYQTTQLWASTNTLKRFNIILEIMKGVDFVDFSGHGSYVSWATHAPRDGDIWLPKGILYNGFVYVDTNYLWNFHKYPVFVFNACSCSKFSEFDSCLSWSVVKKQYGGGIASFGASGIGYGSYGSSETERLFGWMEVNLFKNLFEEKELGTVWKDTLTEYINSFELNDADYKTIYEMALFGDPTLEIKEYT